MKHAICYIASAIAGLAVAFCNFGCVLTETTDPTTGKITKKSEPAPGVLPFLGAAVIAYSPRPIVVREEKSGRISKQEIADRFKPLYGPKLPSPVKP